MASSKVAWGSGGLAMLLMAVGCSGMKLHDVGDEPGDGGAESVAGSAGHSNEHPVAGSAGMPPVEVGGSGGQPPIEVGGSGGIPFPETGGYGGVPYGGSGGGFGECYGSAGCNVGGGQQAADCFGVFDFNDTFPSVSVGPLNMVFRKVVDSSEPAKNTAGQAVFDRAWYGLANFPVVSQDDTSLSFPAQLASIPNNLATMHITRESCIGREVGGRTLHVEVLWQLNGAVDQPTQGLALGQYDSKKKKITWFTDATRAFVMGDAIGKRDLNTLNSIVLEHAFAASDDTDAHSLVLGAWIASTEEVPTTLNVGDVSWTTP